MSTSFECDGCGHHASFHNMENVQDNDIIRRWKEEAGEAQAEAVTEPRRKKRPRRAIENGETCGAVNGSANEGRVEETPGFSGRRIVLIPD